MALTRRRRRGDRGNPAELARGRGDGAQGRQGGAVVIVERRDLDERYVQGETWIGFQITFQYRYSDVYPHFVRGDLARADGLFG